MVEAVRVENNVDLIPFRIGLISFLGTRAIPALIHLAQENDLGSIRIAISALATIGFTHPDEVISQVVEDLIASQDARVRMTGTSVLAEMGPKASMAVSHLAQLLEAGDELVYPDALRALRAIGPDALEAAPAVIQLLETGSPTLAARADDVLMAIGSPVRRLLESAYAESSGILKQRIESSLKRIKVAPSAASGVQGEFAWVKDDAMLELFAAVGEILQRNGPTSHRELSIQLKDLKSQGYFQREIQVGDRNIGKKIEKLEELLSEREGRPILLTDRLATRKGGLTPDGEKLIVRIRAYLESIEPVD